MPTRTRSPSCLALSCSRVYLRSLGTLAIISPCRVGPSTGLLHLGHLGRVERCAHDLRRLVLAANLDIERGADGGERGLDIGDCDVLVDRGAVGAGGDDPDRAAVFLDRVAMTRDGLVAHLDADQTAPQALGADLLERFPADELALGGLDDPAESRLERVGGVVDVVAVERVLHLEPQGVAGAEPDRGGAVRTARAQKRLPELHRPVGWRVELEAVLARVA